MIAALFVEKGGAYFGLPDVDPWDEERDARKYRGPHRVVAHPPCERWGRYWSGGPNPRAARRRKGDDDGCAAAAVIAVRAYGGVMEHPEASHAWEYFGIARPPRGGGWVPAGDGLGWTCCVEQGNYGHPARKATWLFAVGTARPELMWGSSGPRARLDQGHRSKEAARSWRAANPPLHKRTSAAENVATPIPFRDLLLELARSRP